MAAEVSNQLSTNSIRVTETAVLLGSTGNGGAAKNMGKMNKFKKRYLNCFFIGQWPVLYVLVLAVIINFLNRVPTIGTDISEVVTIKIVTLAGQVANAGVLLLYPFLGWLAEAYITYYKAAGCALYLTFVGMLLAFSFSMIGLFEVIKTEVLIISLAIPPLILSFLGNAFFNANAIQLGTDQMLEASSDQLSSFVYWYYWITQVGNILVYIITVIVTITYNTNEYYIVAVLSLTQLILVIIGIIVFHGSKRQLYIQPTRRDTIKNIFKVLWYAKQHKYPQRRSALTYWETTSPSRINLGKEKYGGPFKAEEVEDTKSFLRILLLLVSLFGLYTVDSAKNLTVFILKEYNITDSTDSDNNSTIHYPLQLLITKNPDFIPDLVIFLSIPLLQLVIKPIFNKYYPGMLKRFGLGIVCAVISSITSLAITFVADSYSHSGTCKINQWSSYMPDDVNTVLLMLAIPQVLLGFAKLLIFLTGLEFILAQAPRKVQGLLIGIWYMIGLIKDINDVTGLGRQCELYITSSIATLLSLIFYLIAVYFYKYRRRDDIVDRYNLVVDKVAGRILRREQHKQEWTSTMTVSSVNSQRTSINSSTREDTEDFTHVY